MSLGSCFSAIVSGLVFSESSHSVNHAVTGGEVGTPSPPRWSQPFPLRLMFSSVTGAVSSSYPPLPPCDFRYRQRVTQTPTPHERGQCGVRGSGLLLPRGDFEVV